MSIVFGNRNQLYITNNQKDKCELITINDSEKLIRYNHPNENLYKSIPINVEDNSEICQLTHDGENSIIYKTSGKLWNINHNNNKITLLMDDKHIKQICSGASHTLILNNLGKLWVYGSNSYGQLGI